MITISDQVRKTLLRRELNVAFEQWFRSITIDFWDEANAPEELVDVVMKILRQFGVLT